MRKLKSSTVLAATALVVAVFGSTPLGHAAGNLVLPKNSVGTAQIKGSAVTGLKVKDGSLAASDFAAGQLPAGAQGPAGPKGDQGPAGPPGVSKYELVSTGSIVVPANGFKMASATCPTGKRALGGGVHISSTNIRQIEAWPTSGGLAWSGSVTNISDSGVGSFSVWAVCASVS